MPFAQRDLALFGAFLVHPAFRSAWSLLLHSGLRQSGSPLAREFEVDPDAARCQALDAAKLGLFRISALRLHHIKCFRINN